MVEGAEEPLRRSRLKEELRPLKAEGAERADGAGIVEELRAPVRG